VARFVVFQGEHFTHRPYTSPVTLGQRDTAYHCYARVITINETKLYVPRLPALTHRARNPCHRLGSRRVRVRKSDFVKCSAIRVYICGARARASHSHSHSLKLQAISRHLPVFDVVLVSLSFVKYWRGGSWLSCGSHVHGGSASVSVRRNGMPSRASSLRPPSWRGA